MPVRLEKAMPVVFDSISGTGNDAELTISIPSMGWEETVSATPQSS
jgi:hypothetical protein